MLPYDTDLRVPAMIRGPGITPGSSMSAVVGNVDITPTLLTLAGIEPPSVMDGKSMAKLLLKRPAAEGSPAATYVDKALRAAEAAPAAEEWRDAFLVEYLSVTNSVRGDGSKATTCAAGCNLTNAHSVIWVSAATVRLGCVADSDS